MKKRTREKVALLVFALLVILGGSVLMRYFETGRSWNVAASAVDDVFGQMQGYTAVVYDGTYDPLDALRPAVDPVDDDAEHPATIGAMVAAELSRLPLDMLERPVYASDVRKLYEEKGAGVITLDLDNLKRYAEPTVLRAGDRRIGVVSVDYYASKKQLEKLRKQLADQGADAYICLVPRLSCLVTTEGFQAVIVTDDSQAPAGQSTSVESESAHVIYAPEREQVGVLLLTALNVPSSKVYSSL